jgi:hypothetical protein
LCEKVGGIWLTNLMHFLLRFELAFSDHEPMCFGCKSLSKKRFKRNFLPISFLVKTLLNRVALPVTLNNRKQKTMMIRPDICGLWTVRVPHVGKSHNIEYLEYWSTAIDGTSNFVHGMPLCMPSIALEDVVSKQIIVGVTIASA